MILSSFLFQCRCGEVDSLENLEVSSFLSPSFLNSSTILPPQAIRKATSKMFSSEKTSKKSKSEPPEDEPPPIDVLVDAIIGFLEKANAFTRSVANESFSRVTSAVQGSTIDLILSVSGFVLLPNGHHDSNSLATRTAGSKRVGRRRRRNG